MAKRAYELTTDIMANITGTIDADDWELANDIQSDVEYEIKEAVKSITGQYGLDVTFDNDLGEIDGPIDPDDEIDRAYGTYRDNQMEREQW